MPNFNTIEPMSGVFVIEINGCGIVVEPMKLNGMVGDLYLTSIAYAPLEIDPRPVKSMVIDALRLVRKEEYAGMTTTEFLCRIFGAKIVDVDYTQTDWNAEDVATCMKIQHLFDFASVQFYTTVDKLPFRIYLGPNDSKVGHGWRFSYRGAGSCPENIRTKIQDALGLLSKHKNWAGLSNKDFFDKIIK